MKKKILYIYTCTFPIFYYINENYLDKKTNMLRGKLEVIRKNTIFTLQWKGMYQKISFINKMGIRKKMICLPARQMRDFASEKTKLFPGCLNSSPCEQCEITKGLSYMEREREREKGKVERGSETVWKLWDRQRKTDRQTYKDRDEGSERERDKVVAIF